MAMFAVLENDSVTNIIVADSLEIAEEVTGLNCAEFTLEIPLAIGDKIDAKKLKQIQADKKKREELRIVEEKALQEKLEAARVAAIEAENQRLRTIEAERLAAEEAAKPKPVTGVFVKVSQN